MKKRLRAHVRANVIGYLALFVALGGTAVALPGKGVVDKNDLRKNVVKSKNIKNNTVAGADIKDNAVTGADVNEGTLNFSCASGKTEVNGDCFDSAAHPADDWQHAADACADQNGFLPSYQQLNAADDELGINAVGAPDLWTENRWDDGAADDAHIYAVGTEIPSTVNAGGAQQFRCVFPLVAN